MLIQALNVAFFVLALLFVKNQFQAPDQATWKLLSLMIVGMSAAFIFGTVRYFYVLIKELQDEAKLDH